MRKKTNTMPIFAAISAGELVGLSLLTIFFGFGFSAQAAVVCDPKSLKEVEKFPECDEIPAKYAACGCGTSDSCEKAKAADETAVTEAKKAYKAACDIKAKLLAEGKIKCNISETECFAVNSTYQKELADVTAAAAQSLEDRKKEMAEARQKIKDEANRCMRAAAADTESGYNCRKAGYGKKTETSKDDVINGIVNRDDIAKDTGQISSEADKGGSVSIVATLGSGITGNQLAILRQIQNASEKIDAEIRELKGLSLAAEQAHVINRDRGNNLGPPTPNNGSTITGDTKPNNAPQQQAGGGGPPQAGGGAPPSSGGSGGSPPQNGGAPSSLTDQKNPNSGLAGNPSSGDPSGTNPDGSSKPIGNDSKKADAGTLPGDGIVNISQVRKNVFSPDLKDVGPANTRLADTSGSNFKKDARENLAANEKSSPASGKANGSGSSSSGGSTGDSGSGGKDKKDASAGKSGSDGETASSSGSSGSSSGGASEETLTPFGKPLGDPKFSLAGSETDAQIKNLMGSLNGNGQGPGEGGRDLASVDGEDGIGDKNGPTLFERCHIYLSSCQLKACVSSHGSISKKGGG